MLKSITKTITDLKENIVSQLEEFKLSYQKVKTSLFRLSSLCLKGFSRHFRAVIWPVTKLSRRSWLQKTLQIALG